MVAIFQTIFQINFLYDNSFIQVSPKICSQGSNWQYVSIDSGNGLALNMEWAITWIIDEQVLQWHLESLSQNELMIQNNVKTVIYRYIIIFMYAQYLFNSLWLSDAIWRQRSGSTLAQIMACCLLHQAITWTNVDWSSVKSSDIHIKAISQEMPQPSITEICLEMTYQKFD